MAEACMCKQKVTRKFPTNDKEILKTMTYPQIADCGLGCMILSCVSYLSLSLSPFPPLPSLSLSLSLSQVNNMISNNVTSVILIVTDGGLGDAAASNHQV